MKDNRPFAVVGDTHGDLGWPRTLLISAARANVRTLVHVGDFAVDWPGRGRGRYDARVERLLADAGLRIVVSPGNHDNIKTVQSLKIDPDGLATWRPHIRILPRGGRTVVEAVVVGGLGGAYSPDQMFRTPEKDWWIDEEPTEEEADHLVAGGPVDGLITHDVPAGVPMRGDMPLSEDQQERANRTRLLLQRAVDQLRLPHLFAGHWHQRKTFELVHTNGLRTRVDVLDREYSRDGNAVLVHPDELPLQIEPLVIRGRPVASCQ